MLLFDHLLYQGMDKQQLPATWHLSSHSGSVCSMGADGLQEVTPEWQAEHGNRTRSAIPANKAYYKRIQQHSQEPTFACKFGRQLDPDAQHLIPE